MVGRSRFAAPFPLVDNREDNHFRFQTGDKAVTALDLIVWRAQRPERGVLFVRTITLLEALKPLIAAEGLPVFQLTGEMGDHERQHSIAGFCESPNGVLVMTRTTGGRGLDLPFAHYAVFYSPKTDPVAMWQEMSRIRSTVSNPKDIYVLCCGDGETTKLLEIADALQAQGRRVSVIPVR